MALLNVINTVRKSNKTKVGLLVLALLTYHSRKIEKSSRAYYSDTVHLFHSVFFIIRKVISVSFRRLLGLSKHPYWHPLDEIVVKALGFAARSGEVKAPRAVIAGYEGIQKVGSKIVGHCHIQDIDLGLGNEYGRDAVWITLEKDHKIGTCPIILYYHGGGYCVGTAGMYLNAHSRWLKNLADQHNLTVGILSIEYPLAPEVKYPENLHFAFKAFDTVVEQFNICPSTIIVAGDSAGGAMAFNVGKHAKDMQIRFPLRRDLAGMVLISPWVNHSTDADSHDEHLETDFVAGRELLQDFSEAYCDPEHKALENPAISPIHGKFDFMPPCLTTIGTREVFHNDIEIFVDRAKKSGKSVEVVMGEDCPHIFPLLWPLFNQSSTNSLELMSDFCADQYRKMTLEA